MSPHVATWMRDLRGPDVRVIELSGKESMQPGKDGHVRIDVLCPWCGSVCWLHFGLDGNGRFMCKPCGAIGTAEHGVYLGRREVELTLEGQFEDLENRAS